MWTTSTRHKAQNVAKVSYPGCTVSMDLSIPGGITAERKATRKLPHTRLGIINRTRSAYKTSNRPKLRSKSAAFPAKAFLLPCGLPAYHWQFSYPKWHKGQKAHP